MPASLRTHCVRMALGGFGGALHLCGGSRADLRQVRSQFASGGLIVLCPESQRFVQLSHFYFGVNCQLRRERVMHAYVHVIKRMCDGPDVQVGCRHVSRPTVLG